MTESTSPKHTSGPWMAGEGIDACHVYACDGIYSVIATTDGSDYPEDIENANAALIAAAPDLLEALEVMLAAYIEAIASVCDEPQEGQGPIGKARAAIARASSSIALGES